MMTCVYIDFILVYIIQNPDVKIKDKYISLDAYGFGSAENGPRKYYFELNLFENIDKDVSNASIGELIAKRRLFAICNAMLFLLQSYAVSAIGKKIDIQLKKFNLNLWWPRLTAQPQKPNWIQVFLWHTHDTRFYCMWTEC